MKIQKSFSILCSFSHECQVFVLRELSSQEYANKILCKACSTYMAEIHIYIYISVSFAVLAI